MKTIAFASAVVMLAASPSFAQTMDSKAQQGVPGAIDAPAGGNSMSGQTAGGQTMTPGATGDDRAAAAAQKDSRTTASDTRPLH